MLEQTKALPGCAVAQPSSQYISNQPNYLGEYYQMFVYGQSAMQGQVCGTVAIDGKAGLPIYFLRKIPLKKVGERYYIVKVSVSETFLILPVSATLYSTFNG